MKSAQILGNWIAQLESGTLEQGTGRLHNKGRMCVLGVLCNASLMGRWVGVDPNTKAYKTSTSCAISCLPSDLAAKLKMHCRGIFIPKSYLTPEEIKRIRTFPKNSKGIALDFLNDTGCTFERFAELLRRYFKDNEIKVEYQ